ncbi:MAG TPA: histidine kinase dimerization/phospho-acceptor domain-containing protein, partial [Candidatus Paceibacterota bacterium]|nr:histidine kinase dimerization/phospho-acceptor domain-containing protein [Candidatus Paceibacterota bacterium]
MTAKLRFSAWVLLCAVASGVFAQSPSAWRSYTMTGGLAQNGCASISLSPQGQILVRHFNSTISQLDGYSTAVLSSPVAINGRIAVSPGGQLWMAASYGLQEWSDGIWTFHSIPEIAARSGAETNSPAQIPICSVKQGRVLFLLPDRLMEFNIEEREHPRTVLLRSAGQTRLGQFVQLSSAPDGGLWITGTRGIAKIPGPMRNVKADTEWREHVPPEPLGVKNLQSPQPDNNGMTLLCDSQTDGKAVIRFDGATWEKSSNSPANTRCAWRDAEKHFWAITSDALLELRGNTWLTNTSFTGRKYLDAAVDAGGGFWLATSEGLIHRAPTLWRTPESLHDFPFPVQSLAEDSQGRLWFISEDAKVSVLNDDHLNSFPLPEPLPQSSSSSFSSSKTPDKSRTSGRAETAVSIFPIKNGTLFIGAGENWFRAQLRDDGPRWTPIKNSGPLTALGRLKDGSVCLLNPGAADNRELSLQTFDGATLRPFWIPPLEAPEPGEPLTLFQTRNGDLWFGCERGVAWLHGQAWKIFTSEDGTVPDHVTHFLELPDDKLWCATRDKVWEFDGAHWTVVNGGLEQISDLRQTSDGSIWVASKTGLHRNWKHAWIQNGIDEGLPNADVREVFESYDGRIWAATASGLSVFHPVADQEPPRTMIQNTAGKENIPEGGAVKFTFKSRDKWNLTPRERLLYSHRLDQRDWSPFLAQDIVSFAELAPGKHYFQARAMDRAGNLEALPAQLEFVVTPPWYKEMRLVLISVFGSGAALFFAWLAFNRHLQLRRSYAEVERKVAERTRQLEVANRELLHSQKMNALGTLAAGIAHDFNNILSIIKGSAQIIEDNLDNPPKVQTRLDRIKMVVDQGSGIVKAMLGFSRDSDGQLAPCDV